MSADAGSTPFLTRVGIRNYKSIANCNLRLEPLMFLVGLNGSGKSNFLDVLRFVTDSLLQSLDHALRERGQINEVRRRSGGHPNHFAIRLDFRLPAGDRGFYSFRIGAQPNGGYIVQEEQCVLHSAASAPTGHFYHIRNGEILGSNPSLLPAPSSDRLFLVSASGLAEFRAAYDALSGMAFYNFNPKDIRSMQAPAAGTRLAADGSNLASVLARVTRENPAIKRRLEEYLGKVVPGIVEIAARHFGPLETIAFRQKVAGAAAPWNFYALNMSDGTLRALGVLLALFQSAESEGKDAVSLVGIEEPEIALHPGAAGILRHSLKEASRHTQLIVTSHSPDLLDDVSIDPDSLFSVVSEDGNTRIGPINEFGRGALKDQLYSAGELLRMNQLEPDASESQREFAFFENGSRESS